MTRRALGRLSARALELVVCITTSASPSATSTGCLMPERYEEDPVLGAEPQVFMAASCASIVLMVTELSRSLWREPTRARKARPAASLASLLAKSRKRTSRGVCGSELSHAAVHGEFVSVRERRVEGQENGCLRDLFGTTKALHRIPLLHLLVELLDLLFGHPRL